MGCRVFGAPVITMVTLVNNLTAPIPTYAANSVTWQDREVLPSFDYPSSDAFSPDSVAPTTVFVSETQTKVSQVTGFTTTTVIWSVDEDCSMWNIREVTNASDPVTAGNLVAAGGAITAGAQQSTDISAASLSAGDAVKLLKIFALDNSGNWTL